LKRFGELSGTLVCKLPQPHSPRLIQAKAWAYPAVRRTADWRKRAPTTFPKKIVIGSCNLCTSLGALLVPFTMSMPVGSIEFARRGGLVTRLRAAEDAAAKDMLCAAKTGTVLFAVAYAGMAAGAFGLDELRPLRLAEMALFDGYSLLFPLIVNDFVKTAFIACYWRAWRPAATSSQKQKR
jgi:hypothetical protein